MVQAKESMSIGPLPYPCRPIPACRSEVASIRAEGNCAHFLTVGENPRGSVTSGFLQHICIRAIACRAPVVAGDLPDSGGTIIARSGHAATIRTEGEVIYPVLVAHTSDLAARSKLPDLDDFVMAHCGDKLTIGAEKHI